MQHAPLINYVQRYPSATPMEILLQNNLLLAQAPRICWQNSYDPPFEFRDQDPKEIVPFRALNGN